MVVKRFDVCLIPLDPTLGNEIKKPRPYLVISPSAMHPWIKIETHRIKGAA